jgi:hypothetical protein
MCGGWNALNCLGCSLVGFGGGGLAGWTPITTTATANSDRGGVNEQLIAGLVRA